MSSELGAESSVAPAGDGHGREFGCTVASGDDGACGAATSNPTTSAQSRTKPSLVPIPTNPPIPSDGDGAYAVVGVRIPVRL